MEEAMAGAGMEGEEEEYVEDVEDEDEDEDDEDLPEIEADGEVIGSGGDGQE
jgi:hypothetical protein